MIAARRHTAQELEQGEEGGYAKKRASKGAKVYSTIAHLDHDVRGRGSSRARSRRTSGVCMQFRGTTHQK